jgi:signal transduction histidine kinase/DNA-binding response OmpR family regulator
MTLDTILSGALDAAFLAIFAFSVIDWARHREPVRRAVALVFLSTALVLGVPILARAVPALAPASGLLVIGGLLAQPALALWLVSYFRHVSRLALGAAFAAFLALTSAFGVLLAGGVTPDRNLVAAVAVASLAYFAITDGAASIGFGLAARARAGASRSRLTTAGVATALLGLAVVLLRGGAVATEPGSQASVTAAVAVRVIALLAALGYLAAFVPPRGIRRISQQRIVYDFIRELNALPSGSPVGAIWNLLTSTARRASGAARAEVLEAPRASGQRAGGVEFPFQSSRWPAGRLELDLPPHALFLEDDLELINLLVDRAVRGAEREAFLIERERLIDDLQAASAAKSDFLAAMSHELRTPLNAIIGFSELLSEGGDEAGDAKTVASYSEHIHESGLHLLELVNDVLDLARVEAGRLDLKPLPFELDALVRQTVATMQPLADQKQLSLTLQLAPVTIDADPSRVRQVVLNLLSNAVKFTGDGGEIRLSLEAGEDGQARLTVSDTGRGIPADELERIFEAFHQADDGGVTTHHEGTGLGLALTRQLVEAHGGRIEVRSEVGRGSEFTVTLPVERSAAPSTEPAPSLPAGVPRVLVIEDDPAARELLRVHLESAGYAVAATGSGRQGLAWIGELQPDAVLLDILLPDLDGWEILQRAKSDAATRSIPIMVVSVVDDRELGLALGAVDYVVMPASRERLLEALGRLTVTTKVRTRTITALVIDPDADDVERYRQLLEPDGFRVIGALDGETGRNRAKVDAPDLILLDAVLPDMDGFELAHLLSRDPETASIPIWLTTPAQLPAEAKTRINGNIKGVLTRGDDALVALRAWLETGRRGAPASGASSPAPANGADPSRAPAASEPVTASEAPA